MFASAIRAWALCLVRVFFPTRAVGGATRVPAAGPVVVVANHPNGLLDPLVLRLALGRPVAFLAKSTFWDNLFFRQCVEAFGALPVYRAHEADTTQNERTFGKAHELLRGGGWLALFPEGKSHDATTLQPLKTGAARIALGAGVPITVLPVGLCFDSKAVFRSGVTVAVGVPLRVEPGDPDDRAAVQALTRRMGEALGEVVLQAEDAAVWRGLLAVAAWSGAADPVSREARARALAARWRSLLADDPAAAESVAADVRSFARALREVGVADPFAVEAAEPVSQVGPLLGLGLLAPVALVGAVMAWVPYRLVRPAAARIAGGAVDVMGTVKLLLGFSVLGLTYAAWAGLAAFLAAPTGLAAAVLAALGSLTLGPLAGWAALLYAERLALRRDALRGIGVRLFSPQVALALADRRRELAMRVEAALAGG